MVAGIPHQKSTGIIYTGINFPASAGKKNTSTACDVVVLGEYLAMTLAA